MWRERVREFLFPGRAEREESFRHQIEHLSAISLRIIGFVQIGFSLIMLGLRFLITSSNAALYLRLRQGGIVILLGLLLVLASRIPGIGRWARYMAAASAFVVAGILMWSSMLINSQSTNPNDFIPGEITLVMLVAVTIVPLRPMQTLALGIAIGAEYLVIATVAERDLMEGIGPDDNYMLFIIMLSLLCTGITALLYAQRVSNHRILQQTIEASEALREAQTRVVMSESASSLSRLAAAVSHEMNNPVGALLSGVDTLVLLSTRQASASPEEQPRLVKLQSEIRKSVHESAQRLKDLVARMQRFTNLDQAEIQAADVNEMLHDVTALVDPKWKNKARFEFRLEDLPPLVCRPQQLSIVFSDIVNNAVHALNGNGRVLISTHQNPGEIQVEIEDNGSGMKPSEVESVFDPGFRVSGGRVAAGNWSMFNSRQIVREHGGDIRIASSEGLGTRVTIVLPINHLNPS